MVGNLIKSIRDIMRQDAGLSSDAQRMEQLIWLIFLKIYDEREMEWEFDPEYVSLIEDSFKWRNWAKDKGDGMSLTGEDLLNFVNNELLPYFKNLKEEEDMTYNKVLLIRAMEGVNNYMKNGTYLRQIINIINELDFNNREDLKDFGNFYEEFLLLLQSAGSAGEFYTPRPITNFMAEMVKPNIDHRIADFACGTGGFLISVLNLLKEESKKSTENLEKYSSCIYGIEKKPFPYILCGVNLLINGVDYPEVFLGNTLTTDYKDYRNMEKFDIILMNPPYGGREDSLIQSNFPQNFRSGETFDLFIYVIMERLKEGGKCGLILPDGFFFGDGVKQRLKEKLFNEFNVHTIIRLPKDVFAPYTNITTNILFFDNTGATASTWFYRFDKPEGYKHFSKTKPILNEHLDPVREWWNNREEIIIEEKPKAKEYTLDEIKALNYNIDLCPYPQEEKEILDPITLINNYLEEREEINNNIYSVLSEILSELGVIND